MDTPGTVSLPEHVYILRSPKVPTAGGPTKKAEKAKNGSTKKAEKPKSGKNFTAPKPLIVCRGFDIKSFLPRVVKILPR